MRAILEHDSNGDQIVRFACPGCGYDHAVRVEIGADQPPRPRWTWNGNRERPTCSPSIVVRVGPMPTVPAGRPDAGRVHICHSFVHDGRIQFLSDCTHALAGQTVDLPEVEA